MKIALLADIHSNLDALTAVLNSASDANADVLMVAGDLIGYYFEASETLSLLYQWPGPLHVVRGNHEEMFLAARASGKVMPNISITYGPGLNVAIEQLSDFQADWIANLPHRLWLTYGNISFLLCHGSPRDLNEYVYPDSHLEDLFVGIETCPQVLVLGHTHYPMSKIHGNSLILNPCSVGQPRNGQPGAHWLLLDTDDMSVDHRIEQYDIKTLASRCAKYAPEHPYLSQVLLRT